ncbi:SNF1-related protein kinase regulatory subunit gamma-1-like [Striga hermonthica]|uniref:SNF1-related protein kinase regulatory subunit gamma-1-like n=1 Tax=Striga hermonthica TaxID=68872 RepID=A0A9N7NF50_STRHE|nr:SNF1-related protein kinase regulatory subunit gamma-1-like [Striga hermonthica]
MEYQAQEPKTATKGESYDAYFETVQRRKKLPHNLQESLTASFARIPVSSFPKVAGGKVIEIYADTLISDAVKILSESNILSAPVVDPDARDSMDWRRRYLGIVDYSAIILWVLQNASVAAAALSAVSAAAAGIGTGAAGAIGAAAYRLRNVPVIQTGRPTIENFITQSAVVQGLQGCKGRDWFDCISHHSLAELGLPFMSPDQVVGVRDDELILEAFKKMKEREIGGLPVMEGESRKIVGNISIRDIRFLMLNPELFSNFRGVTVKDFIKMVSLATNDTGRTVTPITCNPESTLGSVIDTLASRGVHRIYVVRDTGNEVLGVITLRDVISCFINEPKNYFDDYFGFSAQEILSQ